MVEISFNRNMCTLKSVRTGHGLIKWVNANKEMTNGNNVKKGWEGILGFGESEQWTFFIKKMKNYARMIDE